MRFIFWQNIVSPHQSFLIKELSKIHEVHLIVEQLMDPERGRQGWVLPDVGAASIHLLENSAGLDLYRAGTHHFFSGIKSYPKLHEKFLEVSTKQKVNIIAESPIQIGYKTMLRAALYRYYAIKYSSRINLIFAMGDLGVQWYRRAGFSAKQVKKFQYTIDVPEDEQFTGAPTFEIPYRLVFIGQLIWRKGVDHLLKALYHAKQDNLKLDIIGDGPLRPDLMKYLEENKMEDQVTFLGILPNDEAMQYLAEKADYLILPSRFDGWGAVVNESLAHGVKVITNDKCGASCMIEDESWGYVYPEKDQKKLEQILVRLSSLSKSTHGEKKLLGEKYVWQHQVGIVQKFLENLMTV